MKKIIALVFLVILLFSIGAHAEEGLSEDIKEAIKNSEDIEEACFKADIAHHEIQNYIRGENGQW